MGSDLGVYNIGYITWLPSMPLNQPPSLALLSSVSLNFFDLLNIFQFPFYRFAVFRVVKPRIDGFGA